MAEVEIVDVHFARVDHDLRRVYLPYGVVEDYVRFLYVDNRFQGGFLFLGLAGGFCVYFVVASFLGRVADELSESRYLAAVSYSAAVSPVEYGLYPVVLCLGFEGYVYRTVVFRLVKRTFAWNCSPDFRREPHPTQRTSAVTQPWKVPLYAQPLRFVVEIALQSRVGIYFQRYLEYGRRVSLYRRYGGRNGIVSVSAGFTGWAVSEPECNAA